jgi:hypothetical protein
MGWAGFLVVIPWVHALIWAFHDSLTIDIRRFPAEEKDAIEKEMARLVSRGARSCSAAVSIASPGEAATRCVIVCQLCFLM